MTDPRLTRSNPNMLVDYNDLLAALRLMRDELEQMKFLLPKLMHSDNLFELQYYIAKEVIPFLKGIDGVMVKWLGEVKE